jgi:hypothetical protein
MHPNPRIESLSLHRGNFLYSIVSPFSGLKKTLRDDKGNRDKNVRNRGTGMAEKQEQKCHALKKRA